MSRRPRIAALSPTSPRYRSFDSLSASLVNRRVFPDFLRQVVFQQFRGASGRADCCSTHRVVRRASHNAGVKFRPDVLVVTIFEGQARATSPRRRSGNPGNSGYRTGRGSCRPQDSAVRRARYDRRRVFSAEDALHRQKDQRPLRGAFCFSRRVRLLACLVYGFMERTLPVDSQRKIRLSARIDRRQKAAPYGKIPVCFRQDRENGSTAWGA
jgi:hypothetical protein